jgi:hypothetical protein
MEGSTDAGLFGITLDLFDDEKTTGNATLPSDDNTQTAPARDAQSEADFQAVRRNYKVRIENGEVSLVPKQRKSSTQLIGAYSRHGKT